MPESPSRKRLIAAVLAASGAAVVVGGFSLASAETGGTPDTTATTVTTVTTVTAPDTTATTGVTTTTADDEATEATTPDTELEGTGVGQPHPDDHGATVSAAAQDETLTVDGNHGRAVSEIAHQGTPGATVPTTEPAPKPATPDLPPQAQGHRPG